MGKELRHSYEYIKEYIEKEGFVLIDDVYINNITKMKIKCKQGHIWIASFSNFLNAKNLKCPHCNKEWKKQQSLLELKEYAFIFGYTIYDHQDVVTRKSKFNMICPNGHNCCISFDKFKQGRRCKICKNSRGENFIIEALYKYNIVYITQYTFDDCKYIHKLLFDFYLPDYNCCIEFDGEQHYEPRFGEEEFIKTQTRDSIKTQYCKDNNIKLIRIPYWDIKNIEKILINELNLK